MGIGIDLALLSSVAPLNVPLSECNAISFDVFCIITLPSRIQSSSVRQLESVRATALGRGIPHELRIHESSVTHIQLENTTEEQFYDLCGLAGLY